MQALAAEQNSTDKRKITFENELKKEQHQQLKKLTAKKQAFKRVNFRL